MKSKKPFSKKSNITPMGSSNERNGLRPVKKPKSGKSKNHLSIYDEYDDDFGDLPLSNFEENYNEDEEIEDDDYS